MHRNVAAFALHWSLNSVGARNHTSHTNTGSWVCFHDVLRNRAWESSLISVPVIIHTAMLFIHPLENACLIQKDLFNSHPRGPPSVEADRRPLESFHTIPSAPLGYFPDIPKHLRVQCKELLDQCQRPSPMTDSVLLLLLHLREGLPSSLVRLEDGVPSEGFT